MSQGSSHIVDMEAVAEIQPEGSEIELSGTTNVVASLAVQSQTSGIFPIARVRKLFRSVDKESYTPDYMPIGPYHAHRSSPRIEQVKLRSVDFLQGRAGGGLAHLVDRLQVEARKQYRDGLGGLGRRENLSRVLLHDGCFLLVFTVDYGGETAGATTSSSMAQNGADDICSDTVVRDTVFLVENQIPFFVLESIHERVTRGARTLLQDVEPYVRKLLNDSLYVSPHAPPILPEPPAHLLHLVHSYFEPPSQLLQLPDPWWQQATKYLLLLLFNRRRPTPNETSSRPLLRTGRWRRATEYSKYGNVRFKRRGFLDDQRWTVLDVLLEGGTLWIPRLRVDSMTWTVLRNLMALELHTSRKPVTAYCVFMSQLASMVEDVESLQRQGILEQFLGSDQAVAQGFTKLCKGVVMDVDNIERNYLKPIWRELHERCNSARNTTIGFFRHKHCGDPMFIAAFLTGAAFFIFQLAQVILALISVLQQRRH